MFHNSLLYNYRNCVWVCCIFLCFFPPCKCQSETRALQKSAVSQKNIGALQHPGGIMILLVFDQQGEKKNKNNKQIKKNGILRGIITIWVTKFTITPTCSLPTTKLSCCPMNCTVLMVPQEHEMDIDPLFTLPPGTAVQPWRLAFTYRLFRRQHRKQCQSTEWWIRY